MIDDTLKGKSGRIFFYSVEGAMENQWYWKNKDFFEAFDAQKEKFCVFPKNGNR